MPRDEHPVVVAPALAPRPRGLHLHLLDLDLLDLVQRLVVRHPGRPRPVPVAASISREEGVQSLLFLRSRHQG